MFIKSFAAAAVAVVLIAPPGRAAGPRPAGSLIVVELFTSQSCSSCPPADDLLTELARTRPDILALDFHVTYWDRLGWKDPYSLPQATQRQRRYSELWGQDGVYTPQLVAGGRRQAVGSDRGDVLAAIAAAATDDPAAQVRLGRDAAGVEFAGFEMHMGLRGRRWGGGGRGRRFGGGRGAPGPGPRLCCWSGSTRPIPPVSPAARTAGVR